MPEARIPLAQAVTYIACAPKSNAACAAIAKATEDVQQGRTLPVPNPLRDANYPGAQRLGHGIGYKYAHDYEGHWVSQEYLGEERIYYEPTEEGAEKQIKERLERWRKQRREGKSEKP
jgi:putative ATPase